MPPRPPIEPHVALLPVDDADWEWKAFERFCLGLVRAQTDVVEANLYGKRGEKQRGIDIAASLTDGRTRTYQCRKRKRFTRPNAEATVKDTTYKADEHVILVTCEVGTAVRDYIDGLPKWTLWDREDIAVRVREVEPRERARRLVEDTFGTQWRKAFLGPQTARAFNTVEEFFAPMLREDRLLRHTWQMVGRQHEFQELMGAIRTPRVRVALLVGRGGIGKTRLLRALGEQCESERRMVLFGRPGATFSDEATDDLPLSDAVVIVDDAHHRDAEELVPLMSTVRERDDAMTLVLATRPQRVDELRAAAGRVGFSLDELWRSEPLGDLPRAAVEDLAEQALGVPLVRLAPALAAATADCPLVTVFGGQLLASQAIPPALLERHDEFRVEVLDRFAEERLGRLNPDIDQETARRCLTLLAAVQPVSVESLTMEKLAQDLTLDVPALRLLLGGLEDAGLVLSRGRLRRIVPDVLADHILHQDCIDRQGRPTGRAEQLLNRYSPTALASVLHNLSELDWRIAQTSEAVDLLASVWAELSEAFRAGNAQRRIDTISRMLPIAQFQPARVLALVEHAIEHPAEAFDYPGLDLVITDGEVRQKLPELLRRIGYSPDHIRGAMRALWVLGRDDASALHSNPSHPIRVLQELGSYETGRYSMFYPEQLLSFVEELLAQPGVFHWLPIQLVAPLLAREGTVTHAEGYRIHWGSYFVDPEATAPLRARVRELLGLQCISGTDKSRYAAAVLLGEALQQVHGYYGRPVPEEVRNGWLPDQLALLETISDLLDTSDDPLVRVALRDGVQWHAERSMWPEVRIRATELVDHDVDGIERMLKAVLSPWDFHDDAATREARLRDAAAPILAMSPDDAAPFLEQWLQRLQDIRQRHPEPGPLLHAVAESSTEHAVVFAEYAVGNPRSLLAQALPLMLSILRIPRRDVYDRVFGAMQSQPTLKTLLGNYLARCEWVGEPNGSEAHVFRELLQDEDLPVVHAAVPGLLWIAEADSRLARELLLQVADVAASERVTDELFMVASRRSLGFSADETQALLDRLRAVKELPYHANLFLTQTAENDPQRVVDLLLQRIRQAREVGFVPTPFDGFQGDVLGGTEGEVRLALLRSIRDAVLEEATPEWEVVRFFWAIGGNLNDQLLVIHEWLASSDAGRIEKGAAFVHEVGWHVLLDKPLFVSDALERASAVSEEAFHQLQRAFSAAATTGEHHRTMGEPAPRDTTTLERARAIAKSLPAALAPSPFSIAWQTKRRNGSRRAASRTRRSASCSPQLRGRGDCADASGHRGTPGSISAQTAPQGVHVGPAFRLVRRCPCPCDSGRPLGECHAS